MGADEPLEDGQPAEEPGDGAAAGAVRDPAEQARARAFDDMMRALATDSIDLYGVLAGQQVDRVFLTRAAAIGSRAASDTRELLVDFSGETRALALSHMSRSKAGFPADEAAGLLSKVSRGSQAAMAALITSAANGRRGTLARAMSVADALCEMFLYGFLIANNPAPGQRLSLTERDQARALSVLLFGEDGHPVLDIWRTDEGMAGPAGAWSGPSGAAGLLPGEDDALRAGVAEARAEALERELESARAEIDMLRSDGTGQADLLEVLRLSGNLSFESAADALAFASEAFPDRMAVSREARADAAGYTGDADEVWRALRALAFEFQPRAALGRAPVATFIDMTGFAVEEVRREQEAPAPTFTGRIGRVEAVAGYVLEGVAGRLKVYFTVLSDGRIGVLRCGGRTAHGKGGERAPRDV